MSCEQRVDDFEQRRKHLRSLSDEALHQRFWQLAQQIVDPLIAEARTHTSASIERSVRLRMGFASVEAGALGKRMGQKALLGHGAGRQVLELARARGIPVRDAGLALLDGEGWEALPL